MPNTYFDNAATSFPKPPSVVLQTSRYLSELGGTYGRGSYPRVLDASRTIETVRELIARILGTAGPERIAFTPNATTAINTVLFGLGLDRAHVLVSPLEHNAVMRPLFELVTHHGVTFDIIPHFEDGTIDTEKLKKVIKPETALIAVNHQSNVNGLMQPLREIKRAAGSIPVLADLSQSLGHAIIEIDSWGLDFAAFTGHKGLLGPTGTGGLYALDTNRLTPLVYGGTGSESESFAMPEFAPDKFEAGTPNVAGLYGLFGALSGRPQVAHEKDDLFNILDGLKNQPGLRVFCAREIHAQGPIFSIAHETIAVDQIAKRLQEEFGIECRSGLHCAPLAHKTLGTFPNGTVRFSFSPYHTGDDFRYLSEAIQAICAG